MGCKSHRSLLSMFSINNTKFSCGSRGFWKISLLWPDKWTNLVACSVLSGLSVTRSTSSSGAAGNPSIIRKVKWEPSSSTPNVVGPLATTSECYYASLLERFTTLHQWENCLLELLALMVAMTFYDDTKTVAKLKLKCLWNFLELEESSLKWKYSPP